MTRGTISKLVADKGFGFIADSEDPRVSHFFHMSALRGCRFDELSVGQEVTYNIENNPKDGKTRAVNVRRVDASAGQSGSEPFTRRPPLPSRDESRVQAPSAGTALPDIFPPFRFAPIDTSRAVVDTPVWHDGSGGNLLSGELRCELEARTPILPGNYRYPAAQVEGAQVKPDCVRLPTEWGGQEVAPDKHIAEPMMWQGHVLIGGSALKGMIRHSLGALLDAPMERVEERHYTYRPNLDLSRNEDNLVCRPAVVDQVDGDRTYVKVLRHAQAVIFARGGAESRLVPGATIDRIANADWMGTKRGPDHSRIVSQPNSELVLPATYRVVEYFGGIDGEGRLAEAFGRGQIVHRRGLVPDAQLNGKAIEIPPAVLRHYEETQRILGDARFGHLAAHPALHGDHGVKDRISAAIGNHVRLAPMQLIYVEAEVNARNEVTQIRSIGHHFRYRWAYTSSVRRKRGMERAEVSLLPGEKECDSAGRPRQLSAARLFFGYVHDEHAPVGSGAYERLAGRIAFNHALSDANPRFLNPERGYCVELPVLGQPRSSAMEFYLAQPPVGKGKFVTYGDLPGDAGGDLAGRKFYLHQPAVQSAGDLPHRAALANGADPEARLATLARFVCAPQTRFRFCVRFANLREWELGALIAALEPYRLDTRQDAKCGDYAHKLGLGRPLGLGSATVAIHSLQYRRADQTALRPDDNGRLMEKAMQAFRRHATLESKTAAIDRWLALHRYVDRGRLGYPTREDGNKGSTIYAWHTHLRREYSKKRRTDGGRLDAALAQQVQAAHDIPPEGRKQ